MYTGRQAGRHAVNGKQTLTSRALATHSVDTVLARGPSRLAVVSANAVNADIWDVSIDFHTETSSNVAVLYCTRQIAGFYTVTTSCGVGEVAGK